MIDLYTVGAKVKMIDDWTEVGVLEITKVDGERLEVRDKNGDAGVVRIWNVELVD